MSDRDTITGTQPRLGPRTIGELRQLQKLGEQAGDLLGIGPARAVEVLQRHTIAGELQDMHVAVIGALFGVQRQMDYLIALVEEHIAERDEIEPEHNSGAIAAQESV